MQRGEWNELLQARLDVGVDTRWLDEVRSAMNNAVADGEHFQLAVEVRAHPLRHERKGLRVAELRGGLLQISLCQRPARLILGFEMRGGPEALDLAPRD